ncbi:FMN-linked oxidoreductase [Hyaloraphidium curvatum]|nr:FMN-linked oxidoreductase [Hyaloraphidium curvatum]
MELPNAAAPSFAGVPEKPKAGPAKPPPLLFTPLKVGGITLKNRIMLAPMAQYSSKDGRFNSWHIAHLGQYATRGAGLVMSEAVAVQEFARITPQCAGLWRDDQMPEYALVAKYIKDQGSVPAIQLHHAGRKSSMYSSLLNVGADTLCPEADGGWPRKTTSSSAIPIHDKAPVPRELTVAEIKESVQAWADCARRAHLCGWEVVDIHAAHGYLIHQFLTPVVNKRTDEYGGSFENRIRYLLEIIAAMRRPGYWPPEKPIFVRLSCSEYLEGSPDHPEIWAMDDTLRLIDILRRPPYSVDLIDASSGTSVKWTGLGRTQIQATPLFNAGYSAEIKRRFGDSILVGCVGGITEGEQAEWVLRSGAGDAVLVGREFMRDPSLVLKWAEELGCEVTYPLQYHRYLLRRKDPREVEKDRARRRSEGWKL